MTEAIIDAICYYLLVVIVLFILFFIIKISVYKKLSYVVLVMLWIFPFLVYVPIEIQTLLFKNQFENIDLVPEPMEIAYFKISLITKNKARLIVIEGNQENHYAGHLFQYKKINNRWSFDEWLKCYWSDLGSADDCSIPPYF